MKDYSAMSDFEINCAVAKSLGGKDFGAGVYVSELRRFDIGHDKKSKFTFDPCNSWADAGPIIQGNEISMISRRANGEWKAEIFLGRNCGFDNYATCFDKNPRRAAMIVFLMMKDAESNA